MSNLNSKEFGRRYVEVIWNQADLSRLEEFTARDIVRHDPASGVQRGVAEYQTAVAALHAAFHPMHFTINWQVGEGDRASLDSDGNARR